MSILKYINVTSDRIVPRHPGQVLLPGVPMLALLVLLVVFAGACAGTEHRTATGEVAGAYRNEQVTKNRQMTFPSYVTPEMQDAYEFTLANPDKMRYIPCYCGCGLNAGHKSNLDCYIAGVDQSGEVVFTDHATYCEICLEVARDTKRLSEEGKSLREIRAYTDATHGPKGPATDTPLPPS